MKALKTQLYVSPNGDRWFLCSDAEANEVFVLHEANVPSGGMKSRVELGAFLLNEGAGPEHQALVRLIGSLVHEAQGASSS